MHRYLSGARTPCGEMLVAIQRRFGISPDAFFVSR
jgi:hypothetical protein